MGTKTFIFKRTLSTLFVLRARAFFIAVFSCLFLFPILPALAATEVNDIADNIVASAAELPGLLAAICYLLGLLLGVLGILKIKDHVENPTQTALRVGFIRLIIGGALFALPMVYEAVLNTIGNQALDLGTGANANAVSGFLGAISAVVSVALNDVNTILANIINSIERIPGFIAALAYLLAIVMAVQGLLKIKDHVETPEQNPLKEGVIRLLVAGALFALPAILNAMLTSVNGSGGGLVTSILGGLGIINSSYTVGVVDDCLLQGPLGVVATTDLGRGICGLMVHTGAVPAFLTAISYIFGIALGVWGIIKIRDHVLNPQQVAVSEGVTRLLAGGAFFALPFIVETLRVTVAGPFGTGFNLVTGSLASGYNDPTGCVAGGPGPAAFFGLDQILVCFMGDVMGPIHNVLSFFAFCGGMIFIMIGISRLTKSAQEGARGPGGIGTITTFLVGGALISYNELMRAFTSTLTGSQQTKAFATMQYVNGMTPAEQNLAHSTITAILQFVIIVGLISFVRGIFIMRGVAEGNQQSSVMSGMTHLVGGALAVNLGPLLNMIQSTLGIGGFGIAFT